MTKNVEINCPVKQAAFKEYMQGFAILCVE